MLYVCAKVVSNWVPRGTRAKCKHALVCDVRALIDAEPGAVDWCLLSPSSSSVIATNFKLEDNVAWRVRGLDLIGLEKI